MSGRNFHPLLQVLTLVFEAPHEDKELRTSDEAQGCTYLSINFLFVNNPSSADKIMRPTDVLVKSTDVWVHRSNHCAFFIRAVWYSPT